MNLFLKKNKNKKIIILDIPLLLENKIYNKNDILVFVDSKKTDINKRLKKRRNFNSKFLNKFKKIQLSLDRIRKKNHILLLKTIITKKSVKKDIKHILNKIL